VTGSLLYSLADGRRIAYAEWGNREGFPCLFFHGSPGSRLFGKYFDEPARRARLRIIAPDRPGFGRSDPVEKYTFLGVAEDALALADGLGLDRFAVVGVSGGAPYVYAISTVAPERITVGGIISGLAPIDDDETEGRNAKLVTAMRSNSRVAEVRLRVTSSGLGWAVRVLRRLPTNLRRPIIARFARSLPKADQEVFARDGIADIGIEDMGESMRQGSRAVLQEVAAALREPWGFDLRDVRVPMLMWHGTKDQNAMCSTARRAAGLLPQCDATYYEGEAHLCFMNHVDEILEAIARAASGSQP